MAVLNEKVHFTNICSTENMHINFHVGTNVRVSGHLNRFSVFSLVTSSRTKCMAMF